MQNNRRRRIPTRLNLALFFALFGLQVAWLSGVSAWLTLPVLLLTNAYWALLHEAIHGALHPDAGWNRRLGRFLAVGHGAPFGILRHGHLLHHRFSRTLEASECYAPEEVPRWRAALRHYATISGGLYAGEVLAGVLVWLPERLRQRWGRRLAGRDEIAGRLLAHVEAHPPQLRAARIDALSYMVVYGSAFWAWGTAWPLLLLGIVGRGAIVSLFDNAYHYGTPLGGDPAEVRNHRLPSWAGWLVLNFHWHGVHHHAPTLPWTALPGKAAALGAKAEGGHFSGAWRQWRGPIPRR